MDFYNTRRLCSQGSFSRRGVKVEWSDDKSTCTTYVDGVACLQRMTYYNKRKVYYVNKSVFEEKGE